MDLSLKIAYHFRIEYFQKRSQTDVKYGTEPCVMLFRSSKTISRSKIKIEEAYALTELRDSMYNIKTVQDFDLLDISSV